MGRHIALLLLGLVLLYPPHATAARVGSQFADDDFVIVWDGSKDVVPSRGFFGDTAALSALGLVDFGDYAVQITYEFGTPGVKPRAVKFVRALLHSDNMSARCAVTTSRPAFCGRIKHLDELLTAGSLSLL